jgi:hypothetical protein
VAKLTAVSVASHERIDHGVGLPESVRQIATTTIVVGAGNNVRAQWVGFNVPQYRQQGVVVLDNRTFEAALPDVAARTVMLAVKFKGLPLFKVGKRHKKRHKVGVFMEDILSIVSAIDDVINQAIVDGS